MKKPKGLDSPVVPKVLKYASATNVWRTHHDAACSACHDQTSSRFCSECHVGKPPHAGSAFQIQVRAALCQQDRRWRRIVGETAIDRILLIAGA